MIKSRVFTDAYATTLTNVSGKPVGRGRQPDGRPDAYYILWRVDRQTSGAPFTDLNEDATLIYQVTCISAPDTTDPDSHGAQNQLEWLEDKAREVTLARDPATGLWLHTITAPGIKVMGRRADAEAGGTSDPTDGIMSSALRFAFDLTST
ncbi:hypothetical protein [Streptomyces longwoodensis]|uniref:hypothetical protein n=1 Tax=Streptomyces longwoodensis TaxID=68231 RepID=UPI00224CA739|nr:hypothetical protein [Streptomyces longwoodensis]MCX5000989.1 hypothetical protein [Streptomyces longwoodensis]